MYLNQMTIRYSSSQQSRAYLGIVTGKRKLVLCVLNDNNLLTISQLLLLE